MRTKIRLSVFVPVLVATSVFVTPLTSFAAGADYKGYKAPAVMPCKNLSDGFYAGLAVGRDSYSVRRNTNLTFGGVTILGNPPLSATGWVGSIFAGYGQYFSNSFYLGGELFVDDSNASESQGHSNSTATSTYNTKFTVGTGYGISILPGLKLNDSSLFYVRLGYNWASLKGTETMTVTGTGSTSASKSSTQGGYNYGVGMETVISNALSLRGEYTYTSYNSFTSSLGTKWSPSDYQFMLGLIYHFT